MQFSYELVDTPTRNAVNAFWFASLVFRYFRSSPLVQIVIANSFQYRVSGQLPSGIDMEESDVVRCVVQHMHIKIQSLTPNHSRSPGHRVPWYVILLS
jgi:hypothetical protein